MLFLKDKGRKVNLFLPRGQKLSSRLKAERKNFIMKIEGVLGLQ
jgi:hypothetical protein